MLKFTQAPHEYRGHLGQIHAGRYSGILGMGKRLKEWEEDEGLDEEVARAFKLSTKEGHPHYFEDKELKREMDKEKSDIELREEKAEWAEFVKDRRIKLKLDEKLKAQEEREESGDLDRKRRMKLLGYGIGYNGIIKGDEIRYGNVWGRKM